MRVDELMNQRIQTRLPEDSLQHAAQLMWDHDCGCVPVCSGDGVKCSTTRARCFECFRWLISREKQHGSRSRHTGKSPRWKRTGVNTSHHSSLPGRSWACGMLTRV
jgi:CBS domain-containing protein